MGWAQKRQLLGVYVKKFLALFIAFSMVVTPMMQTPLFAQIPSVTTPLTETKSFPLELALENGTVASYVPSEKSTAKRIIFIEDAHDSLDAQKSIRSLLKQLKTKYPQSKVFVEGSTGAIRWDVFWEFPFADINEATAQYFLNQGRMSGAEVFSAVDAQNEILYGVEKKSAYEDNVKAYLGLKHFEKRGQQGIFQLKKALARLKGIYYTPFLITWEKEKKILENNPESFLRYLKFLEQKAVEQKIAVTKFDAISDVLNFNSRKIEAKFHELSFAEKLFKQKSQIEEAILKSLKLSKETQFIVRAASQLELFEKLTQLKLSQAEWQHIKANNLDKELKKIFDFLKPYSGRLRFEIPQLVHLKNSLYFAKNFYEKAIKREKHIFKTVGSALDGNSLQTAILVSGGFHTQGFKSYFDQKETSLLVVRPEIKDVESRVPYWEIFQGKKTPLEAWLSGEDILSKAPSGRARFMAKATTARDALFLTSARALQLAALTMAQRQQLLGDKQSRLLLPGLELLNRGGLKVLGPEETALALFAQPDKRTGLALLMDKAVPENASAASLGRTLEKNRKKTPILSQKFQRGQTSLEAILLVSTFMLGGVLGFSDIVSNIMSSLFEADINIQEATSSFITPAFVLYFVGLVYHLFINHKLKTKLKELNRREQSLLNSRGYYLFQVSREMEVVGQNVLAEEFLRTKKGNLNIISLLTRTELEAKALSSKLKTVLAGNTVEHFIVTIKDGRELDLTATPVLNDNGDVVEMTVLANDITSLKELKRLFTSIEGNIPTSVFQMDFSEQGELHLKYMTQGLFQRFGYAPEAKIKTAGAFLGRIVPEYRKAVQEALNISADLVKQQELPIQVSNVDGEPMWVHLKLIPTLTPRGTLINGVMIDVDKIKRAEAEISSFERTLQDMDRLALMGQLGAGILHDIKNPLAAILGNLHVVKGELEAAKQETIAGKITSIDAQMRLIQQIAESLVTFSKPGAETEEKFDVKTVLDGILSIYGNKMTNADVTLVKKYAVEEAYVLGSTPKISQVIMNLVNNALQAMDRPGPLTVSLSTNGRGNIQIIVADSGEGIPEENLARIFDPFFTTKQGRGGTGLGLANSRNIIEEHGGTIRVQSIVGQGTAFTIELPKVEAPQLEAPSKPQPTEFSFDPQEDPIQGVKKVLVVDDDDSIRGILGLLVRGAFELPKEGALTADSAEAALEIFRTGSAPDVVFIDVNMPGIGGIEGARRIHEISPNTVIIMASAQNDEGVKGLERKLEGVIGGVMKKPFTIPTFAATAQSTVKRSHTRRFNRRQLIESGEQEVSNPDLGAENRRGSLTSVIPPELRGTNTSITAGSLGQALMQPRQVDMGYFNLLFRGQDRVAQFFERLSSFDKPLALVFTLDALLKGSLPEELEPLFKRSPKLKIFIAAEDSIETIEQRLKQFDPNDTLGSFRGHGKGKQLEILQGLSIQDAKKRAREHVGRGRTGDAATGVFVLKEDEEDVYSLGADVLKRFAVDEKTNQGDAGFVVGLPTLGLQILMGDLALPKHVSRDSRGIYVVRGLSLGELSQQLVTRLMARARITQSA